MDFLVRTHAILHQFFVYSLALAPVAALPSRRASPVKSKDRTYRSQLIVIMLRRVLALYNNSKVLSCYISPLPYQFDSKNVFYFLYAMLLFQFLGEAAIVAFTYFYQGYVHAGMVFVLAPLTSESNTIPSYGPTSGRRAVLYLHNDEISALLLDVRVPSRIATLVLPLMFF